MILYDRLYFKNIFKILYKESKLTSLMSLIKLHVCCI